MDAVDPTFEELRIIRDRVEEVLGVLTYVARDPELMKRQHEALRSFFGRGQRRAEVLLALNAEMNVGQVANKIGMKPPNVSRELRALREAQLILEVTAGGRGDVWIPNPTLESVLHLSRMVREWYPSKSVPERVEGTPGDDQESQVAG